MRGIKRNIAVLGSTGSIGRQALYVVDSSSDFTVAALAALRDVKTIEEQARKYRPSLAALCDEGAAADLKVRLKDTSVKVLAGIDGICEAASLSSLDLVLNAVSGMKGLFPTMAAIESKKTVALANKETLVTAGEIVMKRASEQNVSILPVDSEHSAIFQCLQGAKGNKIRRILLTASGGPFFGKSKDELKSITLSDALKHPNWSMGRKITIDSATLFNKGLEFIEAMHLFGIPPEKIEVLVHRESIIHSMVEFEDMSVIAQLSSPDMALPIQYAMNYPQRDKGVISPLDFLAIKSLSFFPPDLEVFEGLGLSMEAARLGGTAPAVLNAANEEAVSLFLEGKIGFLKITELVKEVALRHKHKKNPTFDEILYADSWAREELKGVAAF